MFVYKKTEELEKLTPAELDQYKADLQAHEAETRKNEIDAEVKKQVETAKTALKTELEDEIAKQLIDAKKAKGEAEVTEVVKFLKDATETYKENENDKRYNANTTIKAAALMTTANVTPNVTNGFSPLFGNYIDTEI